MPMYEFECKKCGFVFERLLSSSKAQESQECPSCGKKEGERVISAPNVSVQFGAGSCAPRRGFG